MLSSVKHVALKNSLGGHGWLILLTSKPSAPTTQQTLQAIPCSITVQILNKHKQQNTFQKESTKSRIHDIFFRPAFFHFPFFKPSLKTHTPTSPGGIPPPSRGPYPQLGWETRRHPRRPSTAKAFQKLRRHGRHELDDFRQTPRLAWKKSWYNDKLNNCWIMGSCMINYEKMMIQWYIIIYTWNPNVPCVFIGKDELLLEAKQRTHAFQVHILK